MRYEIMLSHNNELVSWSFELLSHNNEIIS